MKKPPMLEKMKPGNTDYHKSQKVIHFTDRYFPRFQQCHCIENIEEIPNDLLLDILIQLRVKYFLGRECYYSRAPVMLRDRIKKNLLHCNRSDTVFNIFRGKN